jgi:DNA-binding NarL/FixJ family response regulator
MSESTGMPVPAGEFASFVLRRIRRRVDWQPWLQLKTIHQRILSAERVQRQARDAPLTLPIEHRDGTNRWGKRIIRELQDLPDHKQFSAIAKLAREKFGFGTTLGVAHSARDPGDMVVEHNHLREWREAYDREQLVLIDPRVNQMTGPTTWTARERHAENPAFWSLASRHGIRSGWVLRSDDGLATLVLSRADPDIDPVELAQMEPNLIMLAHAAHALLGRLQAARAASAQEQDEVGIPANDVEIIAYLKNGRLRKEIAAFMGVSIPTIDRRIKAIKGKLGVETTNQIVDAAVRLGLLS